MKFLAPKFMAVDMVRAGRGQESRPGAGAGQGAGLACAAGDRRAHRAHHVTAEGGPPVAMETASPWQPRGRHGERGAAAMLAAPPPMGRGGKAGGAPCGRGLRRLSGIKRFVLLKALLVS